jgi:hypothetical protein
VKGIHFTEVRRVFNTGLVFDKAGYQLEPLWQIRFLSDDSVMAYSPKMKRYFGFHVYFDHDSIFNMLDAWLKLKKINQDSLVLQSLRVKDKVILDDDEGSQVFMTFYSDRYIKSKGPEKTLQLGIPGKRDTLFIKNRISQTSKNMDSAFSARIPVVLKSKSPLLKVEKVKNVSTPINKIDASVDYLDPEYNITIHKAYEDFGYSFYVFVDDKGKMYFRKSAIPYSPEFQATYNKVIRGIIDGYLQHYLEITPGNTLGIAHTTSILLNVSGKRN